MRAIRQRTLLASGLMACAVSVHAEIASPAIPGAWTNQAGHVLVADLVSCERGVVTLRTSGGVQHTIPLEALRPADQARACAASEVSSTPECAQDAQRAALAIVARYDRLPVEGKTREARAQVVVTARTAFDTRLVASGLTNLPPATVAEVARLRAAIR